MSLPAPVRRGIDAALEGTVVLSFSRVGPAVRSRLEGWTPAAQLPGAGRRVVVTGANSGLGYAASRLLLQAGAEVVLVVRSQDKGRDTVERLGRDLGRDVSEHTRVELAELTQLGSVDALADRLLASAEPLDTIVHNAGAMFATREVTGDGLERTYQLHVVAPFRLTARLLPRLVQDAPTRVITVTSGGMYAERLDTDRVDSPGGYRPSVAYARAKRAQVALNGEWHRRFGARGVGFHVVHPGWALTPGVERSLPGFRRVTGPLLRDGEQGADSVVHLALTDAAELPPGRLWHDRRPRGEHRLPTTRAAADEPERLWERVVTDAGIRPEA